MLYNDIVLACRLDFFQDNDLKGWGNNKGNTMYMYMVSYGGVGVFFLVI